MTVVPDTPTLFVTPLAFVHPATPFTITESPVAILGAASNDRLIFPPLVLALVMFQAGMAGSPSVPTTQTGAFNAHPSCTSPQLPFAQMLNPSTNPPPASTSTSIKEGPALKRMKAE